MSQILKGILGALAISVTFGAVQLASGRDLIAGQKLIGAAPETGVNRAAKADRGALVPASAKTETISFKLDSLDETSVVIRIPVTRNEARSRPTAPPALTKSEQQRKPTVACEPVVSVLTEVAKRLQPGRCVT
jgi:hypothetical protein